MPYQKYVTLREKLRSAKPDEQSHGLGWVYSECYCKTSMGFQLCWVYSSMLLVVEEPRQSESMLAKVCVLYYRSTIEGLCY